MSNTSKAITPAHAVVRYQRLDDAHRAAERLNTFGATLGGGRGKFRLYVLQSYAGPVFTLVYSYRGCDSYVTERMMRALVARHDLPTPKKGETDTAPGVKALPFFASLQEAAEARGIYGPEDLQKG